jgi:hypothetical protein
MLSFPISKGDRDMANTLIFDTLRYANKLKSAGMPEKQAEIQAETLAEIVNENLATKRDLKELELRVVVKLVSILGSITVGCFGILGVLIVVFQK